MLEHIQIGCRAWLVLSIINSGFCTPSLLGATQDPLFQGLGDFAGGGFDSVANAISGDGRVVVGTGRTVFGLEAFRWTLSDGLVGLGDLPGGSYLSVGLATSHDGSVIVGGSRSYPGLLSEAFRWTAETGMVGLGYLELEGNRDYSTAFGVSPDGSIVVGEAETEKTASRSFIWISETDMEILGYPYEGMNAIKVLGISGDGLTTTGFGDSEYGTQAFRRTEAEGVVGLGDLDGGQFWSWAKAISTDGEVIVGRGSNDMGGEAMRWTQSSGMVGLGDLPGGIHDSTSMDVSGNGSVIVGQANTVLGTEAFVWDQENGMRNLKDVLMAIGIDMSGWQLNYASGVSDDGRTIVGTATNPNGDQEAFIAIIPEPSSSLLFGLASSCVLGLRRRA